MKHQIEENKRATVGVYKASSYNGLDRIFTSIAEQYDLLPRLKGRVLLKINLMSGKSPEYAVNTHPEFVRAAVRMVRISGGKAIVGDSSGILGFTEQAFRLSGIGKVVKEEGAEWVNFDAGPLVVRKVKGKIFQSFILPEILFNVDFSITLPKLKTHTLLGHTTALKNHMGLLPGALKCAVHEKAPSVEKLCEALIDLHEAAPFDFAAIDGIWALEGGGTQSGRRRITERIIAGNDLMAADIVAARIMGLNPNESLLIKKAMERFSGFESVDDIDLVGDGLPMPSESFAKPGFDAKKLSLISRLSYYMRGRVIRPVIDKSLCKGNGECVDICPVNAVKLNDKAEIDPRRCIRCFACFERCPENAVKLKVKYFLKPLFQRRAAGFDLSDVV